MEEISFPQQPLSLIYFPPNENIIKKKKERKERKKGFCDLTRPLWDVLKKQRKPRAGFDVEPLKNLCSEKQP